MRATIFALDTAVPEKIITQEDFIEKTAEFLSLTPENKHLLDRITRSHSIEKRHTVLEEFCEEGGFYGNKGGEAYPGTAKRNLLYKEKAPLLAEEVSRKALAAWGGDPQEITHIISVSCTGLIAPGLEFLLIDKLRLSNKVERLGINFMGCFGAFKGLAIAKALSLENKKHRVLLVCTELCSLHFQKEFSKDTLIGNALFADGAAAVVVGMHPRHFEKPLLELKTQASEALSETQDLMTWEVGDFGYLMRLSASIPAHLQTHITPFVKRVVGNERSFDECSFAIHPGGKAILNAIAKACCIDHKDLSASWTILNQFGNMSSPTFLFVLKEILKNHSKEWIVGLGFGPGLSVEGLLLKRIGNVAG